jgi:hypothetical protein
MPNAREIEIIFPVAVPVGCGRGREGRADGVFLGVCTGRLLRRSDRTQPRFSTLIFVHIRGKTVETWKASPDGTKEHRLEAYATLIFRTVERFVKMLPEGSSRAHRYHATVLV